MCCFQNEEVDSDEYRELLVEMTSLRSELHAAFNKEDVLLVSWSEKERLTSVRFIQLFGKAKGCDVVMKPST